MKTKIIAPIITFVLFISIYLFLTIDYKELQQEPLLTIIAYYLGMIVCLPAMLITPLIPDSLNTTYSNAVVGAVGIVVSIVIGYFTSKLLSKNNND
ncbi:MAG: hypothetical protein AB2765_20825 [Candidatus Thiodiazotropha endolucinida]